jgi:cellular nucleic acid-binding protein
MVYIYILKLENNKYYVGKTFNPKRRIIEHVISEGSYWTKLNKPISIIRLISNCSKYDEDKFTLEYMDKYGIENVRGGSFSKVVLSDNNIHTIVQMLNGSNDKCFKCGSEEHFIDKCQIVRSIPPLIPLVYFIPLIPISAVEYIKNLK